MARTVTVALGQHYEEFIQAKIAGGRYPVWLFVPPFEDMRKMKSEAYP